MMTNGGSLKSLILGIVAVLLASALIPYLLEISFEGLGPK
jgi:hypothetical protein